MSHLKTLSSKPSRLSYIYPDLYLSQRERERESKVAFQSYSKFSIEEVTACCVQIFSNSIYFETVHC